MDVNLFHPPSETGEANLRQIAVAKSVCSSCPSRVPCLADAVATERFDVFGVRGGLSGSEREPLVRARGPVRPSEAEPSAPASLEVLSPEARSAALETGPRGRVAASVPPRVKSELVRSGLFDEAIPNSKASNEGGVRANPAGRAALRRWYEPTLLEVSS
jgi:hypothetical protein